MDGDQGRAGVRAELARAEPDREIQDLLLVPSVERGERINVGVVVFCRQLDFLQARSYIDEARLATLAPGLDPAEVRPALQAICDVVAGDPGAGPLAALAPSERFGWVVAQSSTIIQPSPSHTGLTEDPGATLERLFATLVVAPTPSG